MVEALKNRLSVKEIDELADVEKVADRLVRWSRAPAEREGPAARRLQRAAVTPSPE